ncbi:MAG: hypothetical protein AAFQ98_24620, partial [Bacteroidota bacterium]
LDFTLHKDEGNYRGWLNYSVGSVLNRIEGVNRGRFYPATQDQRHEINLVQMYSTGKWDFSSTLVYGSGRPYTPRGPIDSDYEIFNIFAVNTQRLPAYRRIDLAAQYSFKLKKMTGDFGVSIFNVLNFENVQSRHYANVLTEIPEEGEEGNYELQPLDVTSLGITPNLFFNLRF